VTFSTMSIALALLVILGEHGVRSGAALVGGWFVGAWTVLVVAMMGTLSFVPSPRGGLSPRAELAVGVLAILVGAVVLIRLRVQPSAAGVGQSRLALVADVLSPVRSGGLGFALVGLSPRQWVFLVSAAALFSASAIPASLVLLPVAGAGLASVGVAAPIALSLVLGRRDRGVMIRARQWWLRYGDHVGAWAAVVVGIVLIASALRARV
jgi:hypothetical protein